MKWLSFIGLTIFILTISPRHANAQQCADCDCSHFPIPPRCAEGKCCGVAHGTINTVGNTHLVLSQTDPSGKKVQKSFALSPNTKKNGTLKEGAQATVYYHTEKGEKVAGRVDLLESLQGLLVPASEPDPPDPCSEIPSGALKVFLGSSVFWTQAEQATALRMHGTDILILRRTQKGLAVSANLFSADGKIVAQIIDNHFYLNPQNFFRAERPNEHSLIVYDTERRKVLEVRFLNLTSARILGTFRSPGMPITLIVEEQRMLLGTNVFFQACAGNSQVGFNF